MILAANWKMNGGLSFAERRLSHLEKLVGRGALQESFVFFPQPALAGFFSKRGLKSGLLWGASNFHFEPEGAFTGESSLKVFKELGARFALMGHSERRGLFKESFQIVERKFLFALQEGLFPMLCIGAAARGKSAQERALKRQLAFLRRPKEGISFAAENPPAPSYQEGKTATGKAEARAASCPPYQRGKAAPSKILKAAPVCPSDQGGGFSKERGGVQPPNKAACALPAAFQAAHFAVAYEPLWAIGSGKAAARGELFETLTFIRDFLSPLKPLILYGGSVKPSNAEELSRARPDGLLIGGASLDPKALAKIWEAAKQAPRA